MPAETPEALMRSRYTAFVLRDKAYLLATWHPSTRPSVLAPALELGGTRWLGLTIRRAGGDRVEFSARFEEHGQKSVLREDSRFVYEEGRWLYLDGQHH